MEKRIYYGIVEGEIINPRGGESDFFVKLLDDDATESRHRIESSRLRAAGVDYTGARFRYEVKDDGAARTISIISDPQAREEDLLQEINFIKALFGGEEED